MRTSPAIAAALAWYVLCGPLAAAQEPGATEPSTPPAPLFASVGVGFQVSFLRLDGASPLGLPGLELGGGLQSHNLQLRLTGRALAAASQVRSGEGETAREVSTAALELDLGLRLAAGSFSAEDAVYAYVQPSLFLTSLNQTGTQADVRIALGAFGVELGAGKVFKLEQGRFELTATLARVVLSPESLTTQLVFTPGIFVAWQTG